MMTLTMSEPLWNETHNTDNAIVLPVNRMGKLDSTARITSWTAEEMSALRQVLDEYEARIASLEAQLAERWQPLEPGRYDAQHEGDSFEIDRDYLKVYDRNILDDSIDEVEIGLPEDVRLCRLTKGADNER
jgi:hypothetical protein